MRSNNRRFFLLTHLLVLALVGFSASFGSGNLQAQGPTEMVTTRYLGLEIAPAEGTVELSVRKADGGQVYQTQVYGFSIDGEVQERFSVIQEEPLVMASERLRIRFEVIDNRSIAVTQLPIDGAVHKLAFRLRSDDQTRYYGTGERFNALNQRGYILPMITDDRYGNKGVGSHKPVPFVMSSQGFGLWLDSYAPSQFDLSGTERFETVISGKDNSFRTVFFGGPGMADILSSYTRLTGRSPVPPPWAFGLWKSRDVHHNRDSVLVDIGKPRELGIPASVIVLDSPWETGYNNFIVNEEQFPDSQSMFDLIEQRGYYLALWLTPFVNSQNVIDMKGITEASSNYDEAVEEGVLVTNASGEVSQMEWWKGVGGLVDFTDPAAIAWWFDELDKSLSTGVRAFKSDDGEGNFVPDAQFHDGTSTDKMKNRYAVLYDSVMQAYINDRLEGNGVQITRTGYTGTQQYPFAWAGDNKGDFTFNEGLPSVILAGQNAAMSGFSLWGSDIAGYAGTADKEVFIRWTQFAAFTPFMQVHMTSNKGPWDYDKETTDIFRKFARMRNQFFPYLYEAVHESAETGMPVIRPMALAYPNDPIAAEKIYQYMFGPDLLVAPVYQRVTQRPVYLPEGTWFSYWNGEKHEGPKQITVDAPLNRIPLFVRSGSILPKIPEEVETLVPRHEQMDADIVALDDRRVIQLWPGGEAELMTWDGLSVYKSNSADTTHLKIQSGNTEPVRVEFPYQELEVKGFGEGAVRYDAESRTTIVELPPAEDSYTLEWQRTRKEE